MANPIQQPVALGPRASNGRPIAARPRAHVRRLTILFLLPIAAILAAASLPAMLIGFNLLILRQLGL